MPPKTREAAPRPPTTNQLKWMRWRVMTMTSRCASTHLARRCLIIALHINCKYCGQRIRVLAYKVQTAAPHGARIAGASGLAPDAAHVLHHLRNSQQVNIGPCKGGKEDARAMNTCAARSRCRSIGAASTAVWPAASSPAAPMHIACSTTNIMSRRMQAREG